MTRLAFYSAFGALGGATMAWLFTSPAGPELGVRALSALVSAPIFQTAHGSAPRRPASDAAMDVGQDAFSFCLRKTGPNPEHTLRDILAYHDHASTLSLVECLLAVEPQRFCPPQGSAKAADAMEIYFWSRDDARINPPPHGLAEKIRVTDRTDDAGEPAPPDPFGLSWTSPRDRALFDKLRSLASQGYLDVGAFGFSAREDLRNALSGVKPQGAPCTGVARAD